MQKLKVLLGVFALGFVICIAVSTHLSSIDEPEFISFRSFMISGYRSFLPFLQSKSDYMATDTQQVRPGGDGRGD